MNIRTLVISSLLLTSTIPSFSSIPSTILDLPKELLHIIFANVLHTKKDISMFYTSYSKLSLLCKKSNAMMKEKKEWPEDQCTKKISALLPLYYAFLKHYTQPWSYTFKEIPISPAIIHSIKEKGLPLSKMTIKNPRETTHFFIRRPSKPTFETLKYHPLTYTLCPRHLHELLSIGYKTQSLQVIIRSKNTGIQLTGKSGMIIDLGRKSSNNNISIDFNSGLFSMDTFTQKKSVKKFLKFEEKFLRC